MCDHIFHLDLNYIEYLMVHPDVDIVLGEDW